jgi:hypothetical protein
MSTSLDRRAEAAAAAVRAAVAHLEPGPDEVPNRDRRRWPVLVAALVLVAAAIAGAVALRDDDGDTVVAGPISTFRLVPDDIPDGLLPASAADLPTTGVKSAVLDVYGKGPDDDPLRDGDVGVTVLADGFSPTGGDAEVRVRGVTGHFNEGSGSAAVDWEEPGVGAVVVVSHSLGRAALVELADRLERHGDRLVLDAASGFEHVAALQGSPSILEYRVIAEGRGAAVSYQSSGQADAHTLIIAVSTDRPGLLDAFRWLGGDAARRTTVRGHEAWFLPSSDSDDASPFVALGWRERPGVLVTASGVGISADQLRAAVESLRPASDAEWDRLVATAKSADDGDMPILAQGGGWRYTRDTQDGVCFEVPHGSGASGECTAPGALDRPELYEGALQVEGGRWLHGRVAEQVRQVSVAVDAGEPVLVDTLPMVDGQLRAWAYRVPAEVRSATIVALDEKGRPVGRTTVDLSTSVGPPGPTTTVP